MRRTLAVAITAMLLFAACGEDKPEAPAAQSIEVRAANYTFAAPATLRSGATKITLKNAGPEPHQAQLIKLNDGVTAMQIIKAAKAESVDQAIEKLASWSGGPNAVDAGEQQVTTTDLAAGNYAFICLVPDPKGRPHASLGMVKAVTVEENADAPDVEAATYTAATKDFDFDFPSAWNGSITVTNNGEQPHEFQVMEIAEGKTEQDFLKFFQGPPGSEESGPPPFATEGGVAVIAPGASDTYDSDLKPGTYFLMCFVTDPVKKAPHFALGMLKKFVIQ